MIKMQVLTYIVGTGADLDPFVWQFYRDYPAIKTTDVTAKSGLELISDPNAYIVEAYCTEAQYDQVYNDNDYGPGAILWSEQL